MRKSPFSTPRGNGQSPNFGWKSGGNSVRGYGRVNTYVLHSPNNSANSSSRSSGDDFIPLTPRQGSPQDRQPGGNWSSPGANWQSPGRGNRRNWTSPGAAGFNNDSPNNSPSQNNRWSPRYKNSGNPHRPNHKNFQRGTGRGRADLSRYVNLKWFLEDPWAELSERLHDRANVSGGPESAAASSLFFDASTPADGTSFATRVHSPDDGKSRRSQD